MKGISCSVVPEFFIFFGVDAGTQLSSIIIGTSCTVRHCKYSKSTCSLAASTSATCSETEEKPHLIRRTEGLP